MIVVAGATGNVGREVVRLLVEAGQPARALTRGPAKARVPAGATAVAGDLTDSATLRPSLAGATAFLLSGYSPDLHRGFASGRATRRAAVRRLGRDR